MMWTLLSREGYYQTRTCVAQMRLLFRWQFDQSLCSLNNDAIRVRSEARRLRRAVSEQDQGSESTKEKQGGLAYASLLLTKSFHTLVQKLSYGLVQQSSQGRDPLCGSLHFVVK